LKTEADSKGESGDFGKKGGKGAFVGGARPGRREGKTGVDVSHDEDTLGKERGGGEPHRNPSRKGRSQGGREKKRRCFTLYDLPPGRGGGSYIGGVRKKNGKKKGGSRHYSPKKRVREGGDREGGENLRIASKKGGNGEKGKGGKEGKNISASSHHPEGRGEKDLSPT